MNRPYRISVVGGGVAGVEIACCMQQKLHKNSQTLDDTIEIFTSSERVAKGMTVRSIRRIYTPVGT